MQQQELLTNAIKNMLKSNSPCLYRLATTSALIASALAAFAAANQPAATTGISSTPASENDAKPATPLGLASFQKPAWLTDLSLGVKESYDDNVLLSDVGSLKDRSSWITTISPKLGFNFAPLLGDQKTLQVLSLGYAPDLVTYHDQSSESYNAHRAAATIQGKSEALSFKLENAFNYIDGNQDGPVFSNGRSGFAAVLAATRRDQYQDRAKISAQYDQEKWFARPVASFLYYDFLTNLRTTPGYDNYADRYDVNGGADFGYKLDPKMALTLGYRYGHQYQQQYPTAIDKAHLSSPNDYQRVLLGFEGKPWPWLNVSLQGGPDFRDYEANSATHTTPVNDRNPVKYYGEATLTADVTAHDSLAFNYKQWQWLATTGKVPYYDSLYELSYRHKFNTQFSFDLGARLQTWDFTVSNLATSLRNDQQYSLSAGLNYAFTANLSANLAYIADLGRNAEDGLSDTVQQSREYDQQMVTLGVQFKF